jgi:hypothetical protein
LDVETERGVDVGLQAVGQVVETGVVGDGGGGDGEAGDVRYFVYKEKAVSLVKGTKHRTRSIEVPLMVYHVAPCSSTVA